MTCSSVAVASASSLGAGRDEGRDGTGRNGTERNGTPTTAPSCAKRYPARSEAKPPAGPA
eukprot:CAMPEP_0183300906 /NCGR_PEP_ID=MMETSP0160_2-20130417/7178_1 /TAXON_ID=2839 ORGANISM="Odontella Sinensis, Strain Grunow 1884" /NCGR_SAMPLE_ID=MMETSP0160_2 /ASSEMBLY_ACC=CAM_ASM_000250 /LENGTH=59 /DNA_ID=CAMNT_0025463407 /DNA_START=9 /DNA_END=185 /DNA_ORIENTATION=+